MRKLLQINVTANVGSTGRIAEQIGSVAMNAGWESYIAYGRSARNSKSHLIKIGNKIDILYHVLISRLFDKHGLGSRLATRRLVKTISKIEPDIIHLHNIHGYYLNYKILFEYLAKKDIPVVWTLHDCWTFTGHCAHFVSNGCMKWMNVCENCQYRHNYPYSLVSESKRNFLLKKNLFSDKKINLTVVPVSNWLKDYVNISYLQAHHIETIYNGVDIKTFKLPENIKSTRTIIGVASVWSRTKGLQDFLALRGMLPDDIIIKLVGLSDEQIKCLPQGVIGIKRTQNVDELVALYSSADVFVNTTYADTFPTVNLEAMACGTPVVTYKTGGSPESVTVETGQVIEQGNIEELKNAIMTILANGKEYYAKACRKRAEEFFDKDKCFQQYIELYNKILNNK